MSTRSNIFVDYNGERIQFYHHCDGYPEGVGKQLASFLEIATYTAKERTTAGVRKQFLELLKTDRYEPEEIGLHDDIEYLYFVKFIDNARDEITFTRTKPFDYEQIDRLEKAERGENTLTLEIKIN